MATVIRFLVALEKCFLHGSYVGSSSSNNSEMILGDRHHHPSASYRHNHDIWVWRLLRALAQAALSEAHREKRRVGPDEVALRAVERIDSTAVYFGSLAKLRAWLRLVCNQKLLVPIMKRLMHPDNYILVRECFHSQVG